MTDVENLTVQILREIRDEIRTTRTDLATRIDQTNSRLGLVEGTLLDLAKQQRFLVRNARRSARHEAAIAADMEDLKSRIDDLESRVPPKPS